MPHYYARRVMGAKLFHISFEHYYYTIYDVFKYVLCTAALVHQFLILPLVCKVQGQV